MQKTTLRMIVTGAAFSSAVLASGAMPAAQQNALVQKYCAVCHTDAHPNGGLTLEHFDAGNADPGVAAMIVSKLKGNALGASGTPLPDRATQDALLAALSEEATGATQWAVRRTGDLLTASVVREVPVTTNGGAPDLYRLTLTCRSDTHEAEMQLAWSPGVPNDRQPMSASVDGGAPITYQVEGHETMGNGQAGTSGPGAAVLYATKHSPGAPTLATPVPQQSLTVTNLFPGETVVFPFGGLNPSVQQSLSACFSGGAGR